jgi:hypothetical protein
MTRICLLIPLALLCSACELFPDPDGKESFARSLTKGFCMVIGDSIVINHMEIEGYDTSTHLVYLKEPNPFFEDRDLESGYESFTVFASKKSIYSGSLWPAWSSSIAPGTYIDWPTFYPAYVIPIKYRAHIYSTRPDTFPDPRKAEPVIEALQKYGQLHSGLSLQIEDLEVGTTGKVSFTFKITNNDSYDLLILSPDKMGKGLFHYFTNGLNLYHQESGYLTHQDEVLQPEPWNSWSNDWLYLLEHNSSVSYTIEYTSFDEVPPGTYNASFRFPGLSHVEQEDLETSRGRIWLGEISCSSRLTVD